MGDIVYEWVWRLAIAVMAIYGVRMCAAVAGALLCLRAEGVTGLLSLERFVDRIKDMPEAEFRVYIRCHIPAAIRLLLWKL